MTFVRLSKHFLLATAALFAGLMHARAQTPAFPPLPPDQPDLATVLFHPTGQPLAPPVVPLNADLDRGLLELRFDDLSGNYTPWEVRVVHCDRHWMPSDLQPSEYTRGFYSTPMEDDEASFGTKVDFTHHSLWLPNDDLQWTRSGNYLLEVFDPYEPERVVATRRFVVFEDLCRVEAQAGEPNDLALRRTHQEVHFSVFEEGYSLSDPYDRLHVSVVPNWRWDRAVAGLEPRFVKGGEVDFQRTGYVFEGGNTHRFADLKGLEFKARGVARLEERADHFYFYLETDERRTFDYFGGGEDIHGAMVTYNDRLDPYTGSDYVWVHWRLDTRHPLVDRDIHLVGAFSQHRCLPEFRMEYDEAQGLYTHRHLLKQGYYNYHYVVRETGAADAEPGALSDLEGSHFQTNNLYTLVVHYGDWDGYDRVVGLAQWESNP
ncbi:MAG: DUF5103 domain-containing protein [Flavobacteriales bacterium]